MPLLGERSLAVFLAGSNGEFNFPAVEGMGSLTAIVRALDAAGVEPLGVSFERPSLDEVFLSLTRTTGDGTAVAAADTAEAS